MSLVRFIAGSGRSGTTWIQDAIADSNSLRPVFEPLHPWMSRVGERFAHRALAPDEHQPELASYLLAVSAGRGPRLWTQYRQQLRWLFPPPARFSTRQDAARVIRHWIKFAGEIPRMTRSGFRREALVKCIRANLMLPFIARNLDCRIVLVMRHPAAVVESELRGGWSAAYAIERYRSDETLDRLTEGRYRKMLDRELRPVESLALRWVIENQWVAETADRWGIPVFHYESLRTSNRREWMRLCEALGVSQVPAVKMLTRPSQQSGSGRTTVPMELSERPGWMRNLTDDQKEQVSGVLESLAMHTYSMNEAHPVHKRVEVEGRTNAGAIS